MKIKIAYQQNEEQQARMLAEMIKEELKYDNVIKEKHSEQHAPFFHIYLTADSLLLPENKA